MSAFESLRCGFVAGMTVLFAACASRDVPAQYPKTSAASPEATSAKPAEVIQTLAPIEGGAANESTTPPAAADQGEEGHEGHHGNH